MPLWLCEVRVEDDDFANGTVQECLGVIATNGTGDREIRIRTWYAASRAGCGSWEHADSIDRCTVKPGLPDVGGNTTGGRIWHYSR